MKLLRAQELVHLNQRLLKQYGGLNTEITPKRVALVEALCDRVLSICNYEGLTEVADIAAVYCEVIARGHAFTDANKRTAVNAMYLFLHRNGIKTQVPTNLANEVVKVATASSDRIHFSNYIQEHIYEKGLGA